MNDLRETDLIDGLYTVAMEPERFHELIDVWDAHLRKAVESQDQSVAAAAQLLSRHLPRAETILDMVDTNGAHGTTPLHEKVEQEPQAMMAVNERGLIEAVNGAAANLFDVTEGASFKTLNLPPCGIERLGAELRRRFEAGKSKTQTEGLPSLIRVEREDNENSLLISFSDWTAISGRHLVMMKTTNFIWPEFLTPVISEAFGLTEAEADIVRLTVEGASVNELAEMRGSSVATVRSQIRNIYAKTATKNQAEFIRMAIGLTTLQLVDREQGRWFKPKITPPTVARAYPQAQHQFLLDLPDGRILDYSVFGSPDGKPVLFFHNEHLTNIWPAKIAEYATIRGLKIIIPARPYYGRSSPYPKNVNHLEQTADDFKYLLDHLGIEKAAFLSHTLGGIFGLEMATRYPETVAALVTLSPALPHGDLGDEEKMPRHHRFLTGVVLKFPQLLEFVGRAGYKYYQRVGPKRFLYYIYGDIPCDVAVIEDPRYQDLLFRALEFGHGHKHRGYVAGYRHMPKDPIELCLNLPQRLHVIIGDSDKNTRVTRANYLQSLGADIDVVMAKNGADMLIYTHAELVIDTVCRAISKK